jgi:hypothetical protein
MRKRFSIFVVAALVMLAAAASSFGQGAEIQNPGNPVPVVLGVNAYGSTNTRDTLGIDQTGTGFVGLAYFGVNSGLSGKPPGDANSPGCQCEGWGIAAGGVFGGSSDVSSGGVSNGITLSSFTSTSSTALSIVTSNNLPLTVSQDYHPAVGALNNAFEDTVTITNTGASSLADVSYSRVMDFDVPPTEFREFISLAGNGTTTDLVATGDNGFVIPDPTAGPATISCPANTDFTHCGPSDHGAMFNFDFGSLAGGGTKTFSVFYGAAPTEADALGVLGALGVEVYALGESTDSSGVAANTSSGTFFFAFKGVGGVPIVPPPTGTPEPASMTLLGCGLLAVVSGRRWFSKR